MVRCLGVAILSLVISRGADGRGKPEVVSVVGRAGESAVLGCDLLPPAGRPPLHVIEWLRFGFLLPIFIQFGLYSPRIDPDYAGRVRLQKGASLQIEGLRAEDQGWYECRVLFLDQHSPEDDSANGSWVHLTVHSPPQFLETPPQVLEVRELEAVTLRCVARGSPQPHVTWKLRGEDLGQGQGQVQVQNGTLWIRQVERGSSGVYTCQASSTEGSASHATQLLVLGPPVIVVPPKNSTVNASQDVSLACRAEAYPTNLTYSWFQDSTNVFHISRLQPRVRILVDGSLRLQATQPDDAGRYTCVPSNGLLRPPSASAYLTVLYPAQVTTMPPETPLPVGMRGVIRCPVRANPPLLFVSWTKDGQALQLDKLPGWSQGPEGSLIIALGNEDALGEYSCTPYNSLGTAGPSPVTRVLLKAPPAFLERPKEEYFQEVGRELLIPCSAQGDPPPAAPPSPLPGPGPLLQYLSLPFFREMNVDGDWPPFEEPTPAPPPDYMDTRPCPTSSLLHPLDSDTVSPRAALPGAVIGAGATTEPLYTALADWTLRDRLLPSLLPAAPRGSLTSQSSGRGSASFLRPPSTAPSAGGSYLSPAPGDTSSWASGPEKWPRREHVVTVSKRRNTSVDENYEWDSEFPGDMELLETLHLGLAGPRPRPEAEPELDVKTPEEGGLPNTAHAPGPEARCAALREEFLAFRRRRDATRARLPVYRQPVPHPEQATLL
uniref:Immunoglobulin superfamily member 9 n=1 Tax=Ailuropoda melanoleuca TaxID=9646 RepID=A0A7N5P2J4_AILME